MLRTKRSKLTASGTFFAAALAALVTVSAEPSQAQDGAGDCIVSGGGPFCAVAEIVYHCPDGQGGWYECGRETQFLYYERYGNG